jgi:hypothetical protein
MCCDTLRNTQRSSTAWGGGWRCHGAAWLGRCRIAVFDHAGRVEGTLVAAIDCGWFSLSAVAPATPRSDSHTPMQIPRMRGVTHARVPRWHPTAAWAPSDATRRV